MTWRRRWQPKGVRLTLVIVYIAFWFGTGPVVCVRHAESAEKAYLENENRPRVLRLAIPDFIMTGGETRYKMLERALPELIATGLISNEAVEYVRRGEFWASATRRFPIKELENDSNMLFSEKVLDELAIDYVLWGRFFEYRGKIRFEALLTDRAGEEIAEISSRVVDVKEIYFGIARLANELSSEIRGIDSARSGKAVGIVCFKDESERRTARGRDLGEAVAISLISNLEVKDEIVILPYHKARELCDDEDLDDREGLRRIGGDALIKGSFIVEDDKITVYPALYIGDTGDEIKMVPIEGNMNNYIRLESALVNDFNTVLDVVVEDSGGWNTTPFLHLTGGFHSLMERGRSLIEEGGNIYLATLVLSKAIELKYDDPEAHYYLGIAKEKRGRYVEAVNEFEEAIRLRPDYGKAYKSLGDAYLAQDRLELALQAFLKAAQLNPEIENIHVSLGKTYAIMGKKELTVQELEKVIDKRPLNLEAYNILVHAYVDVGKYDKLIKMYNKAKQDNSNKPEIDSAMRSAYFKVGQSFYGEKKYEEALLFFEGAREIKADKSVYMKIAFTLNRMKRYQDTINHVNDAERVDLVNETLYNSKGFALTRLKNYEAALVAFDQGLSINNKNTTLLRNKAWILRKLKHYQESLNTYDKAIIIQPDYARNHSLRGSLLCILMRYDEAIKSFDKAIEIEPDNMGPYSGKAYALAELQRYEEAIKVSEIINKRKPSMANGYNHKGFSLYQIGEREKGIILIKKAIEKNSKYGGSFFNLARIYSKENNIDAAVSNLINAIKKSEMYIDLAKNNVDLSNIIADPRVIEIVRDR